MHTDSSACFLQKIALTSVRVFSYRTYTDLLIKLAINYIQVRAHQYS